MCSVEAVGSIPAGCIFFSVDLVDLEFNTTSYHMVKSLPGEFCAKLAVERGHLVLGGTSQYMWLTVKTSAIWCIWDIQGIT